VLIRINIKLEYPSLFLWWWLTECFKEFTTLVQILKIVLRHTRSKRCLVREGMIAEGERETEFRAIWRRVVTGRKASWRDRNRCRKLAGRRRVSCKHHAAKENVSSTSQQTETPGGGGCALLFWRQLSLLMPGQCSLNQNLWLDVKLFEIYRISFKTVWD
jgi:hypothetical protein